MATLQNTLQFLSSPTSCPLTIVALNPRTGQPIAVNSTFESIFGPFYKFKEWDFSNAACEDASGNPHDESSSTEDDGDGEEKKRESGNRSKFTEAIGRVRNALCVASADGGGNGASNNNQDDLTGRIRNIEMLTLGTNEAGLPIKHYFDWTIGSVNLNGEGGDGMPASAVILYGDMVNEAESSDRARDAELVDFLQNAPIAMHWLNGDGIVLWANQTELNVLGYTPEEYIGQPIMNFCPDEKDLVLEIFKQLGSGNAIADVPVRFRTKDGKLVHLLIDSNVAYNPDGSFGHTRCFIRDDTARKIRNARTKLLLEENERSLRMLESFLSKTLHHVMGPLHALRITCEIVSDRLHLHGDSANTLDAKERENNSELLDRATETITTTTRMVADVSDLARFDEGATLKTKFGTVSLHDVGLEAIEKIQFDNLRKSRRDDGISVSLSLVGRDDGPESMNTDRPALLRILAHLLENSVREVDTGGKVTLQMTSIRTRDGMCSVLVEVMDNGKGLPPGTCLDQGGYVKGNKGNNDNEMPAAALFNRYLISKNRGDSTDPDQLQKIRSEMEEKLRDLKHNGVGVGLPLSYHLVRVLGGDLRHEKLSPTGTKIWFVLPNILGGNFAALTTKTILKKELPPAEISFTLPQESNKRKRVKDDADFGTFVSASDGHTDDDTATMQSVTIASAEPAPEAVAKSGVKASTPFSVLVVEDTDICARLLMMQLKKMKCSTQRAENGRVAVDLLRDAIPGTYDMVLMDLRMPVMDGLEATKIIRNDFKMNDLPILALTGEMRDDIQSECERIGLTEFLQKPLPRKKLQELVTKYKAARDGVE
mmetsp:Transcript_32431/g.47994  ORF Transcript_32431/g.47994 Transcript_32431/m.47994 type:complete len:825 (+) Transcript_32431:312-2786(+)